MAGPFLSPGWLVPPLALAFPGMPSVSGPLRQHRVRPKVRGGAGFVNNRVPLDATQL